MGEELYDLNDETLAEGEHLMVASDRGSNCEGYEAEEHWMVAGVQGADRKGWVFEESLNLIGWTLGCRVMY